MFRDASLGIGETLLCPALELRQGPADGRFVTQLGRIVRLIAAGVVALGAPAAVAQTQSSPAQPPSQPQGGCSGAPQPGSTTLTLTSGGQPRSALVHVPRGTRAGRELALVLVLHGFK